MCILGVVCFITNKAFYITYMLHTYFFVYGIYYTLYEDRFLSSPLLHAKNWGHKLVLKFLEKWLYFSWVTSQSIWGSCGGFNLVKFSYPLHFQFRSFLKRPYSMRRYQKYDLLAIVSLAWGCQIILEKFTVNTKGVPKSILVKIPNLI